MKSIEPLRPYTKKRLRTLLSLSETAKLPTLVVVANVFDNGNETAYLELAFRNSRNKYCGLHIEKSQLHRPATVRDLLLSKDAALPTDGEAATAVVVKALSMPPKLSWTISDRTGWSKRFDAFVMNNRVIGDLGDGKANSAPRILSPSGAVNAASSRFKSSGSLKEWKRKIAGEAKYSSTLTLGLAVGFSAPLLKVVGHPNFLVVIHGESKIGKSAAAVALGSVIGIGREADLQNWNGTDNGLLQKASEFNDLPMVNNGIESQKLKGKQLSEFLDYMTYALGDGKEKARHSSWGGSDGTWHTIGFVTSELSFSDIAALAASQRKGGAEARAYDVPAAKTSERTIFNRPPVDTPKQEAERNEWLRKRTSAIYENCALHHGVAFKPCIEYLIKQGQEKVCAEVKADMEVFSNAVKGKIPMDGGEQLHHAARNFSFVYAGGIQAVKANILPLSEIEVRNRIRDCFVRGLRTVAAPGDHTAKALDQLTKGIERTEALIASGEIAGEFATEEDTKRTSAWVPPMPTFKVKTTLFTSWFDNEELAWKAAMRWLDEQGLLEVRDPALSRAKGFTLDSVRSNRKLNGADVQCVVFKDPRPTLVALAAEKEEAARKRLKSSA